MHLSSVAERRSPTSVAGFALIALLAAIGILLAFRSGSYPPRVWLPVLVAVTACTLMVVLATPPPRWTRGQTSLLATFTALAVWTAASTLWAGSFDNAWEETNRTFLYLLGFTLSATAVLWAGKPGARVLVWAVLADVAVVAAVGLVRLVPRNATSYFESGRFHYPISYWNGLAALYMIGFWLALGLSTGRPGRRAQVWTRPLLVGVAVALAELALLPQSRGAFYAFFLVAPLFVVLSQHRFRAMTNLALAAAAVVAAWSRLVAVMPAAKAGEGVPEIRAALWAVGLTAVGAVLACALTWLIELRVGRLSPRWVRRIGLAITVLVVTGVAVGLMQLNHRPGGIVGLARTTWSEIVSDSSPGSGPVRFTDVGLNGRLQQWRVAWRAFAQNPVFGLGAQNFEPFFNQHRYLPITVRQPHSQPMQLLAELGLAGFLLGMAVVFGVLGRATLIRFRTANDETRLLLATMIIAAVSWCVHASVDWLWQLGGVTWPAVLLLGGLLAAGSRPRPEAAPSAVRPDGHERRPLAGHLPVWIAGGVLAIVLASAALQLVFLRYTDAAQGAAADNPSATVAMSRTAARLDPFSPIPAKLRAAAYTRGARQARNSTSEGNSATLDDLALASDAWREAAAKEPGSWLLAYNSGVALLDYRDAVGSVTPVVGTEVSPEPGAAPGSLAMTTTEKAVAATYRAMDREELTAAARKYLTDAERLNPLSPEVKAALGRL